MKKVFPLLLMLSSFVAFSQTTSTKGNDNTKRVLREITLTGAGYELGLQHGKLLKKEIAEIVIKWKENTTRALGKDASQVLKEFFQYAQFDEAIKKWTPDLYEE